MKLKAQPLSDYNLFSFISILIIYCSAQQIRVMQANVSFFTQSILTAQPPCKCLLLAKSCTTVHLIRPQKVDTLHASQVYMYENKNMGPILF